MRRSILLLTLLALAACGAPPAEVTGQIDGAVFSVSDLQPQLKLHKTTGDATIVLAEEDGKKLRTVVLYVDGDVELRVGKPIQLGQGVRLVVSEGVLEVTERGEERIINTRDPVFHGIVKGEVMFTSLRNPIEGEFWAEMDNGGFLEGTFVLDGVLR